MRGHGLGWLWTSKVVDLAIRNGHVEWVLLCGGSRVHVAIWSWDLIDLVTATWKDHPDRKDGNEDAIQEVRDFLKDYCEGEKDFTFEAGDPDEGKHTFNFTPK